MVVQETVMQVRHSIFKSTYLCYRSTELEPIKWYSHSVTFKTCMHIGEGIVRVCAYVCVCVWGGGGGGRHTRISPQICWLAHPLFQAKEV